MSTNPFLDRIVLDDLPGEALATLALVHEQRTANMIALATLLDGDKRDAALRRAIATQAVARTVNIERQESAFNSAGGA